MIFLKVETVDELHHQVGVAAFIHREIVDLGEVRVVEANRDLGLAEKAAPSISSSASWGRITLMTRTSSSRLWRTL